MWEKFLTKIKNELPKEDAWGNKEWEYLCEEGKYSFFIGAEGEQFWKLDDKYHCIDAPAVIKKSKNGYTKYWYLKGKCHREDGPAIISLEGTMWFLYGKLHRENGPAIEHVNGNKEWWINDEPHREDGPAIEWSNGNKHWYHHGKYINCSSQEEFEKLIKLKAFW